MAIRGDQANREPLTVRVDDGVQAKVYPVWIAVIWGILAEH